MRFSFSDAHNRLEEGGWTREVTIRELPASDVLAGVNMSLAPGAYREMHWHKEAEWGLMLYGSCRITAIDKDGYSYIDEVKKGDLWNFEGGMAHSIQALEEGCEFLLVFSDATFSENNTMLLTDWLAHTPRDIIAANFRKTEEELQSLPTKEKYIFNGTLPEPIEQVKRVNLRGEGPTPVTFHMEDCHVWHCEAGSIRVIDSRNFPAAQTISAAIVEVEPGGMRELHWHPEGAEWQYFIQGQAKMTVFNSNGLARTYDFKAGDVGYVPLVAGHYLLNTGTEKLIFVELFKNPRPIYSDISLNKWLSTTPVKVVAEHLNLSEEFVASLPKEHELQGVMWYDPEKIKEQVAKYSQK